MIARSRTIAESLLDRLLDAFPPERPYDRAAWSQDPMPGAVAHFLEHALQQRVHRETVALRQACASEWVDDEHPSVRRARQLLSSSLEEHAHIPAEAWTAMLSEAVRRVVAYVAEPRRTLVEQIFEDEPLPVTTVRQQMAAFAPYAYLHEGVEAYLRDNDPDTLTADHFDGLLRRIDRRATAEYDTDDWMRLLDPVYGIVAQANPEEEGVPVPLLGAFFSEKGHRRAVRRLREVHEQHQADQLSSEALRRLLDEPDADAPALPTSVRSAPLPDEDDLVPSASAMSSTESPAPAESAVAKEQEVSPASTMGTLRRPGDPTAPAEASAEADGPPVEDASTSPDALPQRQASSPSDTALAQNDVPASPASASDDPVPLWKQFQQGLQRAPATGERVTQRRGFHSTPDIEREEEDAPAADTSASPALPRWMQYHEHDEDEGGEGPSLDVLERSVLGPSGPRNRDLFLDELFEGEVEEYATTLQRLLGAPSWAEASKIIAEDVFRKHQVNIYSDPAVLFTDAAELRYRR